MKSDRPTIPTNEELTASLARTKEEFDRFLDRQRWAGTYRDESEEREWRQHVHEQFEGLIRTQVATMQLIGILTGIAVDQAKALREVATSAGFKPETFPTYDPERLFASLQAFRSSSASVTEELKERSK